MAPLSGKTWYCRYHATVAREDTRRANRYLAGVRFKGRLPRGGPLYFLEVILMPRRPGERYADSRRKTREQRYNASRPARHGFYSTPEWRRLRDWYRARHPLCEECQRQGRVTAAELVHHRVEISEGGAPLDPENLESLCWSCHSKVHAGKLHEN